MAALLPPSPEDGMIDGQQSHPTIIPEKILTDLVGPHPTAAASYMTTIVLTRHGHVEGIRPKRFRGREDLTLTQRGEAEARAVAEYIAAQWRPTKVYASPLRRCAATGAAMGAAGGTGANSTAAPGIAGAAVTPASTWPGAAAGAGAAAGLGAAAGYGSAAGLGAQAALGAGGGAACPDVAASTRISAVPTNSATGTSNTANNRRRRVPAKA